MLFIVCYRPVNKLIFHAHVKLHILELYICFYALVYTTIFC